MEHELEKFGVSLVDRAENGCTLGDKGHIDSISLGENSIENEIRKMMDGINSLKISDVYTSIAWILAAFERGAEIPVNIFQEATFYESLCLLITNQAFFPIADDVLRFLSILPPSEDFDWELFGSTRFFRLFFDLFLPELKNKVAGINFLYALVYYHPEITDLFLAKVPLDSLFSMYTANNSVVARQSICNLLGGVIAQYNEQFGAVQITVELDAIFRFTGKAAIDPVLVSPEILSLCAYELTHFRPESYKGLLEELDFALLIRAVEYLPSKSLRPFFNLMSVLLSLFSYKLTRWFDLGSVIRVFDEEVSQETLLGFLSFIEDSIYAQPSPTAQYLRSGVRDLYITLLKTGSYSDICAVVKSIGFLAEFGTNEVLEELLTKSLVHLLVMQIEDSAEELSQIATSAFKAIFYRCKALGRESILPFEEE